MAAVVDRWKSEPERKGKGKRWLVRYKDDSRQDRRKAFERKVDAERYAREVERQLDIGTYRDPSASDVPFGDYAASWLDTRYDLRPSTKSLYKGFIENHLQPRLGVISMGRLRPAHGHEYLAQAIKDGVSESLTRKTMVLAKSIMSSAVEDGLLAMNPFSPVRLPKEKPREAQCFTSEELTALLNAVTPHYRCFVLTAAVLGLRFGELCGLRPVDLDLLHGRIQVTGQLVEWDGKPKRVEPKTEASIRTVAVPPFLVSELNEQLSERSSKEYVFTSFDRGPIRKSNFNRRHWQPALKKVGLEGRVFHELRHTAVAFAIEAGAHPKAIQDRIGHASITTTLNVYGHLMPGLDSRLAERLDERLSKSLAPQERPKAVNN